MGYYRLTIRVTIRQQNIGKPACQKHDSVGRIEKQKKELTKITCDNTSLMEQIVSMGKGLSHGGFLILERFGLVAKQEALPPRLLADAAGRSAKCENSKCSSPSDGLRLAEMKRAVIAETALFGCLMSHT